MVRVGIVREGSGAAPTSAGVRRLFGEGWPSCPQKNRNRWPEKRIVRCEAAAGPSRERSYRSARRHLDVLPNEDVEAAKDAARRRSIIAPEEQHRATVRRRRQPGRVQAASSDLTTGFVRPARRHREADHRGDVGPGGAAVAPSRRLHARVDKDVREQQGRPVPGEPACPSLARRRDLLRERVVGKRVGGRGRRSVLPRGPEHPRRASPCGRRRPSR